MVDRTAVDRVKRQRDARLAEGWQEVRVWVPTEQDAEDIRNLAKERRDRAEALHGLTEEVSSVTPDTAARIAHAIAEHGSAAYTHSSGAVLDLMTTLADEDDLQSFAKAFVILARAKPASAASAAGFIPGKISNFLIKHRGVDPASMMKWTHDHPDWTDLLKDAVRDPERFEAIVETMAGEMKRTH
jgi:hypothetical protein